MSKGKLIVITGPSGVGKGTLVRSLFQKYTDLYFSISATTRKPREGEINGKDYFFLSHEEFKMMIEKGDFLEWAEYAGNYYGTPRHNVESQINQGKKVILEIEVIGANLIKKSFADALRIFILPPSMEVLEQRLKGRGTDSNSAIIKRLNKAQEELKAQEKFDIKIINDDLDIALQELETAIFV